MMVTLRGSIALLVGLSMAAPLWAQVVCQPAYRIVHKTIYEEQPVTTYRLEYETVYQQKQVTSYKPTWFSETRTRRYTVAKPVYETSEREERYTVLRPEWTTEYRERSYDRTHYVTETQTRQERIVVNKPVTETVMQNYNYTTYKPVTTMRTQYVDQGGFVDQQVHRPGAVRNRLQWVNGYHAADPITGHTRYYRGGLHWVPQQNPGVVTTRRMYVPNVVAQQIPQTTHVPQVVTAQRPVQVTRWQRTEEIREVPHTVQKPVTERIVEKVPVKTFRWVRREMVRKVPTTTYKMQYEERSEDYQVKVCKMVAETKTVQVPHTVSKWVAYTSKRLKPRTVVMRIPIDPNTGLDLVPAPAPPADQNLQKVPTEAPEKSAPKDTDPTGKPEIDPKKPVDDGKEAKDDKST